jgi:hypothetical protein
MGTHDRGRNYPAGADLIALGVILAAAVILVPRLRGVPSEN